MIKIGRIRRRYLVLLAVVSCFVFGGMLYLSQREVAEAYSCDSPGQSSADISRCMEHVFPSRRQLDDYLSNTTFVTTAPQGFIIDYYERGGGFTSMSFDTSLDKTGVVDVAIGYWRPTNIMQPLKSGPHVVNVPAERLCTSAGVMVAMSSDNETPAECQLVWQLDYDLINGGHKNPYTRLEGDAYGLSELTRGFFSISQKFRVEPVHNFSIDDVVRMTHDVLPSRTR